MLDEEGGARRRTAGVEIVEIDPPLGELRGALGPRADAVVGDVVDQAAEAVDREHRLALGLGHQPHGGIEGAVRRLALRGGDHGFGRLETHETVLAWARLF